MNFDRTLMVSFYNINDIKLGKPFHSGHETYPDASHTPPGRGGKPIRIIFKKNKFNNPQYSQLEIAFSKLARLFMFGNSIPDQKLVVDDSNHIVGLGIEHLCYVVEKNEGLNHPFYSLKHSFSIKELKKKTVRSAEKIPLYFLDQLPPAFFKSLLKAEKSGSVRIDYASLASIFASSFTLEEDDLHKGNFGFYLVEHDGKPKVVFFKIDHDLMFADSIMSYFFARPSHWMNSDNAFNITAKDLLNFPNIRDSANSYWPTKLSFFPNPWNNKEYHNQAEVESFSRLKDLPEFKKAKWLSFYKHILLPDELIARALNECLDASNSCDRARIALFTQATAARQAQLRSVLFSIKEFRHFLVDLTADENNALINEILRDHGHDNQLIVEQIKQTMQIHQQLCAPDGGIDDGDTPLHIAIKLGDYRYEETLQKYGHLINKKNNKGQTPLDCALERIPSAEAHPVDVRQDLRFTMRHLLEHGASQSKEFKLFNQLEKVEQYKFATAYLDRVTQVQTYDQFKDILRDIGEDHRFCLKNKKNLAIQCVTRYTKENRANPEFKQILTQLKKDINGRSPQLECAGLQYIRQLRSRLWIIRQIRGLFGWTSTQGELNSIIDHELKRFKPNGFNCFSFFCNAPATEQPSEVVHSGLKIT
ncbi:cardiac ankyrin repeat-containing protein [Legionella moravica]|uniref:Ankyrin n=1 Tax=Legionella moravica TaxID=39962 RepID=A0A378JSS2_9GAMM|nr:Dot/Icm T4SS effector AnkK/LegA5 [Legionella moravica]KTD31853.1 cardiac ankyrin repeat-containing protein [Legionella moravica]STX61785.1 ankyrin [Legionella moravica]